MCCDVMCRGRVFDQLFDVKSVWLWPASMKPCRCNPPGEIPLCVVNAWASPRMICGFLCCNLRMFDLRCIDAHDIDLRITLKRLLKSAYGLPPFKKPLALAGTDGSIIL